jgi:predicted nucleotidyltransferase
MTSSSLSLKRPLDAALVTLLTDVDQVCKSVQVEYLLTGSMSREIALYHVYGLDKGRGTADVDFGIAVQSWEQFEQLRAAFLVSGLFDKDPNPSVFWSRRPGRLQVDLVPFGAIQKDDGAIAWPPEERQRMNVLGYEAALRHAWRLPLPNQVEIPMASLPGTVLLKLMAWRDRGEARGGKDALDLMTILESYDQVLGQDALFGPFQDLLVAYQFDQTATASQVLGAEVRDMADARTLEILLEPFTEQGRDSLKSHMIRKHQAVDRARPFARAGELLRGLERGLRNGTILP